MSASRPKGWAIKFHDKSENENNIEKHEVKEYHSKLLNMKYNMMICLTTRDMKL